MLEIRSLHKSFQVSAGDHRVIADLNLDIEEGEFFTLLGPSGCGKTTLLRCIAGLERPDDGEIRLAGQLLSSASSGAFVHPEDRPISMVFQSYAVWPHMTVYDNVAYPLVHGENLSGGAARDRVDRALDLVRLRPFALRSASVLSGGQLQRVALARAIIREPRLLLMDEPLSNLDAKLREDMRLEIRELTRSLGITILHVTHDQLEAMALADRLAVMNEGQILDIGSPEAMYYAPRSQFVAEFMARTNWLDAIVMSERAVESSVGTVACAVPSDLGPGSRVLLGIRPEAITLRPTPPQTGAYFRGFIQSRLFLGDVSMYKVRVGDADLLVKANRYSTETEEVFLEAEPEKWLLFSRHQGEDAPPPT